MADLPGLLLAPFGDPNQLLAAAAAPVLHVLLVVLAAQAAIAVMDYVLGARCAIRGSLRMSRHDIHGGAEGDRGRSAREGAAPADPHVPRAQADAGGGAEGDGGDHQSDPLRGGAGL